MRQHHGEVGQLVRERVQTVREAVLHISQLELLHHPLTVIVVGAPLDKSLQDRVLLMVVHQSEVSEVLEGQHNAPLSDPLT